MSNPYLSSPPHHAIPVSTGKPPGVWYGYVAYCIFLSLIYLVAIGAGVALVVFAEPIAESDRDGTDPALFVFMGTVLAVVCLPFFVISAIGPLLPRNRFGWIYGIVLIAFGLTSGCTIIFAVILLVFWLQEPAKRFYNLSR